MQAISPCTFWTMLKLPFGMLMKSWNFKLFWASLESSLARGYSLPKNIVFLPTQLSRMHATTCYWMLEGSVGFTTTVWWFLGPTSSFLLVNFVERIQVPPLLSYLLIMPRISFDYYFSPIPLTTFLGPLCDFVNPSLWSNLSPAEGLFFLSLCLIPSLALGTHFF